MGEDREDRPGGGVNHDEQVLEAAEIDADRRAERWLVLQMLLALAVVGALVLLGRSGLV